MPDFDGRLRHRPVGQDGQIVGEVADGVNIHGDEVTTKEGDGIVRGNIPDRRVRERR